MIRRAHREGNKTVYSNWVHIYTPAYCIANSFSLSAIRKIPREKKHVPAFFVKQKKKRGSGINQTLNFLEVEKTILLLRQLCYQLTELPEKLLSQSAHTPLL